MWTMLFGSRAQANTNSKVVVILNHQDKKLLPRCFDRDQVSPVILPPLSLPSRRVLEACEVDNLERITSGKQALKEHTYQSRRMLEACEVDNLERITSGKQALKEHTYQSRRVLEACEVDNLKRSTSRKQSLDEHMSQSRRVLEACQVDNIKRIPREKSSLYEHMFQWRPVLEVCPADKLKRITRGKQSLDEHMSQSRRVLEASQVDNISTDTLGLHRNIFQNQNVIGGRSSMHIADNERCPRKKRGQPKLACHSHQSHHLRTQTDNQPLSVTHYHLQHRSSENMERKSADLHTDRDIAFIPEPLRLVVIRHQDEMNPNKKAGKTYEDAKSPGFEKPVKTDGISKMKDRRIAGDFQNRGSMKLINMTHNEGDSNDVDMSATDLQQSLKPSLKTNMIKSTVFEKNLFEYKGGSRRSRANSPGNGLSLPDSLMNSPNERTLRSQPVVSAALCTTAATNQMLFERASQSKPFQASHHTMEPSEECIGEQFPHSTSAECLVQQLHPPVSNYLSKVRLIKYGTCCSPMSLNDVEKCKLMYMILYQQRASIFCREFLAFLDVYGETRMLTSGDRKRQYERMAKHFEDRFGVI